MENNQEKIENQSLTDLLNQYKSIETSPREKNRVYQQIRDYSILDRDSDDFSIFIEPIREYRLIQDHVEAAKKIIKSDKNKIIISNKQNEPRLRNNYSLNDIKFEDMGANTSGYRSRMYSSIASKHLLDSNKYNLSNNIIAIDVPKESPTYKVLQKMTKKNHNMVVQFYDCGKISNLMYRGNEFDLNKKAQKQDIKEDLITYDQSEISFA